MGSSTENSAFGPTRNPWDLERIPGGSSGGSAAAVAADFAPLSLGSDTGGSIRQPAALCGVVGLKPTYGRVSRYGLIAFASSLDQVGPFGHDVRGRGAAAGGDRRPRPDAIRPASTRPSPTTSRTLDTPPDAAPRSASPASISARGWTREVEAAVREAIRVYEAAGATIKEVSLPHLEVRRSPAYYLVATAECSSNLARYDGTIYGHRAADFSPKYPGEEDLPPMIRMMMASRAEGFGAEVKRRIMLGTFALSAGYADQYYNKALQVRRLIRNDFDAAFREVDVILGPTSPTAAFKLGEKTSDPLAMYLSDIYTITTNLAGIPGLSLPCGFTKGGLPIGLQLLASPFAEETLLQDGAGVRAGDGLAHDGDRRSLIERDESNETSDRASTDMEYTIVIGLEVHVQLLTESKMFSACGTDFGLPPNTQTDPVSLGMPGTLPVMNGKAFELALKTAVALHADIAGFTKWDRKNYYYPDLPKNYQISQYDLPFSHGGWLDVPAQQGGAGGGKCGLTRVHLEEDTGKLTHGVGRDVRGRSEPGGDSRCWRSSPSPICAARPMRRRASRNCGSRSATSASPTARCRRGASGATRT